MMQNSEPLVSVIMPAYNAEKYIEAAIRSVMNQTVTQWELLVIDDGSKDQTCAVVETLCKEDPRIRLLKNEKNMGVARTRNRGFDLARGAYTALLDSDDIWYPQKLERQLKRMEQENADIAYCSYGIIGTDGQKVRGDYLVPGEVTLDGMLKENLIGCSTVVLSAKVLRNYRFDVGFFHEDYALWLHLLKDGYRAAGCEEVLVDWRFFETSRSFNKWKSAKNRWHIYRKSLGLPFGKSVLSLAAYATAGLRKYTKRM